MDRLSGSFKVFFEPPFWVGVIEEISNGKLSACKITFGSEPNDSEIFEFIQKNYYRLNFSPSVAVVKKEKSQNPKRIQREISKSRNNFSISTKSQEALKIQHEQIKCERKKLNKDKKKEKEEYIFKLKQQKKKAKKKGR